MKIPYKFTLPLIVAFFSVGLCSTTALAAGPVKIVVPIEVSAYLSGFSVNGDGALDICADGYHFASIWELQGLSPFIYNTSLGRTGYADQGEGPPAGYGGWVRSGWHSSVDYNCENWTSNTQTDFGLTATFVIIQIINGGPALKIQKTACGPSGTGMQDVWCISDAVY